MASFDSNGVRITFDDQGAGYPVVQCLSGSNSPRLYALMEAAASHRVACYDVGPLDTGFEVLPIAE